MATDFDTPFDDSSLRLRVVGCGTLEEVDQSSPWDRAGDLRLGDFPILWGLVGSPQGEDEEEIV